MSGAIPALDCLCLLGVALKHKDIIMYLLVLSKTKNYNLQNFIFRTNQAAIFVAIVGCVL
jgi:hypothetical protein